MIDLAVVQHHQALLAVPDAPIFEPSTKISGNQKDAGFQLLIPLLDRIISPSGSGSSN